MDLVKCTFVLFARFVWSLIYMIMRGGSFVFQQYLGAHFIKMDSTYRGEVANILEKAKSFDQHLQKLKDLNLELVKKSQHILTSINKIVALKNHKCSVCFTRERRVVFQPCGHCFCSSCADRATGGTGRGRCFTCRANIEHSFTIYLWIQLWKR